MSEPVQEAPRPKRGAPPTRGRRGARYGALQQVYSTLINPSSAQEMTLAALASEHLRQADRSYLQTLIHGVVEQREALEAQLSPLCDRGLAQLDAMEHALLLLGAYELNHEANLPARAVINEAVELAKTFGATDGHRYINGVLDRLARELRPLEYGAG